MKALRIVPKKLRKILLISQLQKLKKSKERKEMIHSRQSAIYFSGLIEKRANEIQKTSSKLDSKNPIRLRLIENSQKLLGKRELIDSQSINSSNTKLQRKKLRQFFELPKKVNKK